MLPLHQIGGPAASKGCRAARRGAPRRRRRAGRAAGAASRRSTRSRPPRPPESAPAPSVASLRRRCRRRDREREARGAGRRATSTGAAAIVRRLRTPRLSAAPSVDGAWRRRRRRALPPPLLAPACRPAGRVRPGDRRGGAEAVLGADRRERCRTSRARAAGPAGRRRRGAAAAAARAAASGPPPPRRRGVAPRVVERDLVDDPGRAALLGVAGLGGGRRRRDRRRHEHGDADGVRTKAHPRQW